MNETFGDPTRPALLLIHGAGNTMLSWDEALCARLAQERFVLRFDLRPAASYDELVAQAVRVLDAYDVARAHVLGLSLGGGIAQRLALDHPERVAALTLVATTPGGPGHEQPDLPAPTRELPEPPAPDWHDRDAVIEYIVEAERPYSAHYDEAAMRALAARVVDHDRASLTGDPYDFDAGAPWRHRLGEISVPTLVIHGADDPLFGPAHGEALANEIPGARLLVLERMGHEYFPRHTWDAVLRALSDRAGSPSA